jgi:hypothetical protein
LEAVAESTQEEVRLRNGEAPARDQPRNILDRPVIGQHDRVQCRASRSPALGHHGFPPLDRGGQLGSRMWVRKLLVKNSR